MSLNIITTYNTQLSAIVSAILHNTAAAGEATAASTARKGTLADALRAYATATAEDGVSVDDGRGALRLAMLAAELKTGTVKGYGASYNGFRAMIEDGEAIEEASVKDAQDYVASDAVKQLNKAKEELRKAMKPIKDAATLLNIATYARTFHKAEEAGPVVDATPANDEAEAEPARTGTNG